MPLAETLEITVNEPLEGKLIENTAEADIRQAEELVKKVLAFSDQMPERSKEQKKKHRLAFGMCILAVLSEWLFCILNIGSLLAPYNQGILVMQPCSVPISS